MYALGAILLDGTEMIGFRRVRSSPPVRAATAFCLVVVLIFLATGAFYGRNMITRNEAVAKAGLSSEAGKIRMVYWLPSNSGISVVFNPFAGTYNDAVLNDLLEARGLRSTLGAWIVADVDKIPTSSRTPFLPETPGDFNYIDAITGRIILSTVQ